MLHATIVKLRVLPKCVRTQLRWLNAQFSFVNGKYCISSAANNYALIMSLENAVKIASTL